LGVVSSDICSTESVSEGECLEAARSLLPEGQGQGRRNLVAGSWNHVPAGCSLQSGGDWAAHYNRRDSGINSGAYTPVCTGHEGVTSHLSVAASNFCTTESVNEVECLHAVRALLPDGQDQGRRNLVAGQWNHVPPGCSVQSGGDWAAHYNRRSSGFNDGGYTPVCAGHEALDSHLGAAGTDICTTESVNEAECRTAVRGLLPDGQAQGRQNLVAGSWGHVPAGCSVQSGGDWAAHFNRRDSGINSGAYSPVCTEHVPVTAHLGAAASNFCRTDSVTEAGCLEAVRDLLPDGQAQGRHHLVAGQWNHVPPGCSAQSGGDWAAHFNRRGSGNNDGGYSPVCIGHEVINAHFGVAASNTCDTQSVSEAECREWSQVLLPEGQAQGRRHLVAGSWGHVPPGCSVQSGGDWAAHYNRRGSGNNHGGYTPVCIN